MHQLKVYILEIEIDTRVKNACPEMQIGIIRCKVNNSQSSEDLWNEISKESDIINQQYQLLEINKRPAIAKTRELYKALGKDPNRYRVSSEALCRRIIKGLGLYKIDTLVDLINLFSIKSGYAIGGFDANKIVGNKLILTSGSKSDIFEGIGRGLLNIEGLPVYKDKIGGIGTPTSDEERTKITLDTTYLHMNINAFAEEMPLLEMIDWCKILLEKYANASDFEIEIIK